MVGEPFKQSYFKSKVISADPPLKLSVHDFPKLNPTLTPLLVAFTVAFVSAPPSVLTEKLVVLEDGIPAILTLTLIFSSSSDHQMKKSYLVFLLPLISVRSL